MSLLIFGEPATILARGAHGELRQAGIAFEVVEGEVLMRAVSHRRRESSDRLRMVVPMGELDNLILALTALRDTKKESA